MARRLGGEAEIHARIAAAPGLSPPDAHKLAGLLEAESSLAIVPNNRDGWRCLCQIALRDDDRDTLITYRGQLGIGHLQAIPARAGSRPQVGWTISSKVECTRLVDVLDIHPLRGRKLAQYEIWREAVALWAARRYGVGPGVRERLKCRAAQLKTARRYLDPTGDEHPDMSDPHARHYFTGFFSGEGSFGLGPRAARVVIKLRRDEPLARGISRRVRHWERL